MLTAMMLGNRFSIVALWPHWRHLYAKTLKELGLEHACASIRSIDIAPDNQALLGGKEEEVFPLLLECALACIEEDRAEVILLGSTTMHQAHAYLAERLAVPVINPGPLTYNPQSDLLYLNRGDGTFIDGSAAAGLDGGRGGDSGCPTAIALAAAARPPSPGGPRRPGQDPAPRGGGLAPCVFGGRNRHARLGRLGHGGHAGERGAGARGRSD